MHFNGEPCTLFILPCDLIEQGRKLGPETVARLKKATGLIDEGFNVKAIVMTAGISPDKEEMMADWLRSGKFLEQAVIYTSPNESTWTSMEEILAARKIIIKRNLPNDVVVVSSSYHIPRLWITWIILKPKNWKMKFVPAWDVHVGIVTIIHEILAIPIYVLRALQEK